MRELKLGGKRGMTAVVDDEDFERVSKLPWHPQKSTMRNGDLSTWYVQGRNGLMLHRFILGITDPNVHVDHRDRNGLNNCRSNLRTGNQSQNLANRPKAKSNTSGFKGVYFNKRLKRPWTVVVSHKDKLRSYGTFETAEAAAHEYDRIAKEQWGEFAYLNFPENTSSLKD